MATHDDLPFEFENHNLIGGDIISFEKIKFKRDYHTFKEEQEFEFAEMHLRSNLLMIVETFYRTDDLMKFLFQGK